MEYDNDIKKRILFSHAKKEESNEYWHLFV